MNAVATGEILVPGDGGTGLALVLSAPISFWGGVEPKTGRIADVRHPECGDTIAGRVLFLPGTIGSSSASAVLLELVHNGHAPAALVLHDPDAILLLGLIVAREMGWPTPIALKMDRATFDLFRGRHVGVADDGKLTIQLESDPVRKAGSGFRNRVRSSAAEPGPADDDRRNARGY